MSFALRFTKGHLGWKKQEKGWSMTEEFEQFWNYYPRKVGKLDAIKAFSSVIRQGYKAEDISAGALAFAEMCRREGTEPRFVPYPATWLRAGRWMDETLGNYQPIDPERAAADKDKADRILRRGKYAVGMQ